MYFFKPIDLHDHIGRFSAILPGIRNTARIDSDHLFTGGIDQRIVGMSEEHNIHPSRLCSLFDHLRGARDFELLEGTMHALRSLADGMLASCGRELDEPEEFSIAHYPTFDHLRAGVKEKLLEIVASMPDGPAMSAPVLEAVRYIRHHFREDVSLADVARHIDMSQSWLTKRFNRECGGQ